MVDRAARDRMAAALRSYMDEGIRAFAFDEALDEAKGTTADGTVDFLRFVLWQCYDDIKNHKIVATRERWDLFNRLLLLLDSDAEIDSVETTWERHPQQLAATGLLLGWSLLAACLGWGPQLLLSGLPFGPPAMAIARLDERREQSAAPAARELAMTPFGSVAALRAVRRQVAGFKRRPYPSALRTRRIRGILDAEIPPWLLWGPRTVLWCLFSPAVLVRQLGPEFGYMVHLRVVVPESVTAA